nr:hypothetical protein [Oenococcus oeni]
MTKFYEKNYQERLAEIVSDPSLAKSFQEQAVFEHEKLIENYLTDFSLPVGVLYRLQVDGKNMLFRWRQKRPALLLRQIMDRNI